MGKITYNRHNIVHKVNKGASMINNNLFFKPTTTYREFIILDLIEKNPSITQRDISKQINVSVSLVNGYLDNLESKGYLKREYHSTKHVEYFITSKGIEHRKLLNIWYLKSSYLIYESAKNNIIEFINQIVLKGFKKILLYGAGEVTTIMLQVIQSEKKIDIDVVSIIDDFKEGQKILDKPIYASDKIDQIEHDGILISSHTHHSNMKKRLLELNYNSSKIIEFFN